MLCLLIKGCRTFRSARSAPSAYSRIKTNKQEKKDKKFSRLSDTLTLSSTPHAQRQGEILFYFFFFLQTTNFHFRKIVTPYLCQVCSRIDAESRVTGSSFLLFSGITFFCFFIHDIRGDERDPRKNPLRHLRRPPVRSAQRVTP